MLVRVPIVMLLGYATLLLACGTKSGAADAGSDAPAPPFWCDARPQTMCCENGPPAPGFLQVSSTPGGTGCISPQPVTCGYINPDDCPVGSEVQVCGGYNLPRGWEKLGDPHTDIATCSDWSPTMLSVQTLLRFK